MSKVRLAVISRGLGPLALCAAFFPLLKNGELVAHMDEGRARACQRKSGARCAYTELDALLDDREVDAVIVVTPPNVYTDQVVRAAQTGKHIFCEKPMAPALAEVDRMIAACHELGVKLQIGFMKRFNRSFHLARRVIEDGSIGEVSDMRIVWCNARTRSSAAANYRHRVVSGGGHLQEDGSHPIDIDICPWWLGMSRRSPATSGALPAIVSRTMMSARW